MKGLLKVKQIVLLLGDLILLYLSLLLTLIIRYQQLPSADLWQRHFSIFSVVFGVWLIVFYIADFYSVWSLKNNFEFNKKWGGLLLINFILAMAFFYFLPTDNAFSPKTNLLLLILIFGIIGFFWRRFYNALMHRGNPENKILIIGDSSAVKEIISHIKQNPQLGYDLKIWLKKGLNDPQFQNLSEIILKEKISLIVVPAQVKKDSVAAKKIYQNIVKGIEVIDLSAFYSFIFQKVPLGELEEIWFLENIARNHKIYDSVKRPIEVILAILLVIILFVPGIIISLLIKITSKGPLFYANPRIGEQEKKFTLYKFRNMYHDKKLNPDADSSSPTWATPNDSRITPLGRILRSSHLDEIPQLINIIKGDMSFVGPRPERPEFVDQLKKVVPYYDLRHLVKPGLTGWAQISYRYGSSIEDTYQKLQYDIYYLKNYSFWLDLSILIKTIKLFFISHK